VSKHLKPIIEERFEKATFSQDIIPGLAEIGAFGPMVPVEYGGMGLDQISYGLIMQEIERCDSGLRSLCSVQGSLVMYPIWKYGSEEQKKKWLPQIGGRDRRSAASASPSPTTAATPAAWSPPSRTWATITC
jgi:glutaryl-CoA dehydrogenase